MRLRRTTQPFRKLLGKRKPRGASRQPDTFQDPSSAAEAQGCSFGRMSSEHGWQIISAYGKVLEECSSSVEPESSLPFPKPLIREAICRELAENPDTELRHHLEIAYAQLESFLPPEEFRILEEFKLASTLAHRMSRSGDPRDIIDSARILKLAQGEKAVRIQEKISNKMRKRLQQIQTAGMPFFSLSACVCSQES